MSLRDFINDARSGEAQTTPEERKDHARNYDRNTNTIAVHNNTRWTDAEIETAMDPDLTTKESAVKLGRTLVSVRCKRKRVRDASKN